MSVIHINFWTLNHVYVVVAFLSQVFLFFLCFNFISIHCHTQKQKKKKLPEIKKLTATCTLSRVSGYSRFIYEMLT